MRQAYISENEVVLHYKLYNTFFSGGISGLRRLNNLQDLDANYCHHLCCSYQKVLVFLLPGFHLVYDDPAKLQGISDLFNQSTHQKLYWKKGKTS